MKKDIKSLCSLLAEMEGKKRSVAIGDVRELMRCFADVVAEDSEWLEVFALYAVKRAKRK
jgi:hypothetical protein